MPEKRYTKVEEEILQILDKMEVIDERPARAPLSVVRAPVRKSRFVRVRGALDVPWLSLAVTAAFAFLAVVLAEENSHLAATTLAVLSILAFLSPVVIRRRGSPRSLPSEQGTKLWRGRDISLDPSRQESPADRARRWLDRRRDGRR